MEEDEREGQENRPEPEIQPGPEDEGKEELPNRRRNQKLQVKLNKSNLSLEFSHRLHRLRRLASLLQPAGKKSTIFSGTWHRFYSPRAFLYRFRTQCSCINYCIVSPFTCSTHCISDLHSNSQSALYWLWAFNVHSNIPCRWLDWVYCHYLATPFRLTSFNNKN